MNLNENTAATTPQDCHDAACHISRHAPVMSLAEYVDGDYITKAGLAAAFACSGRTIQRMVERLEIPPPMTLAGRKVWIVGKLRAWIAASAQRQEVEALKAMGPLRAFEV